MEHVFYQMEKTAWDCRTGGYDSIERQTGALTLGQVRTRVKRLPDSTICNWNITMYELNDDSEGGSKIIGLISAEEFEIDVPRFEDDA